MGSRHGIAQLKVEEERSPRKLHKNHSKMTLVGRSFGAIRRFTTTAARRGGDGSLDHIPPPGHNLPFDISNRYKLTVSFILLFKWFGNSLHGRQTSALKEIILQILTIKM